MSDKEQLTLKHLSPYLPYGLKCIDMIKNWISDIIPSPLDKVSKPISIKSFLKHQINFEGDRNQTIKSP